VLYFLDNIAGISLITSSICLSTKQFHFMSWTASVVPCP